MFYRGFDTSQFPGLPIMAALRRHFDFCGYYLPAPSHQDRGWCGRRKALAAQGWGFAPIFVGQETVGPGSHVVTKAQGVIDGNLCAAHMRAEGFPEGSRVFLDLENGPPFGLAEAAYVVALLDVVRLSGFTPGVYCSHAFAGQVVKAWPDAAIWAFKVPTTARTSITSLDLVPPADPAGSGYFAASLWQYRQNVSLAIVGDTEISIDLNSARTADPSAP